MQLDLGLGLEINKVQQGSGLSYSPELIAYKSGIVTPLSAAQLTKLDTLIKALKTGLSISTLSDFFDTIHVLANETAEAGLRNLVKRASDATAVNSPTFTALEGFLGNGTSSYINTNYNPATQGVNFTLNSSTVGIYERTNSSNNPSFGSRDGVSGNYILIFPVSAGKYACRINQALAVDYIDDTNVIGSSGIMQLTRTASNAVALYHNASKFTANGVSSVIPSYNLYGLGRNESGTAGSFSARQHSIYYSAKGINDSQAAIIAAAFEAYMDSNGKGIIA